MENQFDDVMANRTDAELINILQSPSGDYQPSALESAKREFKKRNLSDQRIGSIKEKIAQKNQIDDIKANEPLPTIWKVLAFAFPGIIQIIFAGIFKAEGSTRKLNELVKCTLYGFLFYLSIVILLIILIQGFHL